MTRPGSRERTIAIPSRGATFEALPNPSRNDQPRIEAPFARKSTMRDRGFAFGAAHFADQALRSWVRLSAVCKICILRCAVLGKKAGATRKFYLPVLDLDGISSNNTH